MYKTALLFAILILSANTVAFGDQSKQVITLKDGSQIKGQLSGIDNGIYTVKTPIIGDVHVAANDVASITNVNAPALLPANTAALSDQSSTDTLTMDQKIAANQKALMSNPQSMATLQEMAQDPEIMQALQDPALVQAITSKDYQAVQNNPQVQALLSNPKMQALMKRLASQQQHQQQSAPSQ